jgi:hypothetical protein
MGPKMKAHFIAFVLVLVGAGAAARVEVWQGTFSYAGLVPGTWLAHNIPINITVDNITSTATVEWTWEVLSNGSQCVPKKESGLKVGTEGQQWFARGTGTDPQFYSLVANLTNGDTLSDGIIYDSKDGAWPASLMGTFSAKKNTPSPSWQCRKAPTPTPTPPKRTKGVWPLPANVTGGNDGDSFLSPTFAFKCDICAAGSLLPTAFDRYSKLIYGNHHSAPSISNLRAASSLLTQLEVHVDNLDERSTLQFGMEESYTLRVPISGPGER